MRCDIGITVLRLGHQKCSCYLKCPFCCITVHSLVGMRIVKDLQPGTLIDMHYSGFRFPCFEWSGEKKRIASKFEAKNRCLSDQATGCLQLVAVVVEVCV